MGLIDSEHEKEVYRSALWRRGVGFDILNSRSHFS